MGVSVCMGVGVYINIITYRYTISIILVVGRIKLFILYYILKF